MNDTSTQRTDIAPALSRTPRGVQEGRWRWWYESIADCMIRQPNWKQHEIAAFLNKAPNTISAIINTDLFREYLARRKAEWRDSHDHMLRSKLTDVAAESLDIMLDKLRTQRGQIPLQTLEKVSTGVLDRLGYAPSTGPTVVVDNSTNDNRQQTVQIAGLGLGDLEAAREAMRLAERMKSGTSLAPPDARSGEVLEAEGVETSDADVSIGPEDGKP